MEENIYLLNKSECTGCGACYNICPVNAISMEENEEGFLYPVIDKTKCTNCGLCKKHCPILNLNKKNKNTKSPKCYAVMADDEIRRKSSSGGMFTLLANYVLSQNGFVCGAVYNSDWSVSHCIVDNQDELQKLRGSKYLQSETNSCYKQIKKLLREDKAVLFTGCPCQVAGLYNYLEKDYDKLITMELLCHGTPSYKIFKKYLDENHNDKKIERIEFRDKSLNWSCTKLSIYHDNGEFSTFNVKDDPYEKGFHKGLFNRQSCAPCNFAKLPRQADFTVADWWGIKNINADLDDTKGTSLVLINNQKSSIIFEHIKPQMYKVEEIPLETAKKSVNVTIYKPLKPHQGRNIFFRNLKNHSVKNSVSIAVDNKFDVGILGLFAENNYGCILTGYALYKIIEDLGYTTAFIDRKYQTRKYNPDTMSRQFLKKQNVVTVFDDETTDLNNKFNTFVCGSDQLWNYSLDLKKSKYFLLDFAFTNKKKIAYATSFGERWKAKEKLNEHNLCHYLFKRFNNISVREDYAVSILKENFDIDATQVLDPVFVTNPEIYYELAGNSTLELPDDYIFAYILDPTPEKNRILKYTAEKLNKKLYVATDADYNDKKQKRLTEGTVLGEIPLEDWLKYYKNASYIITDSFHGTCFSIIFKKQFISIGNYNRGIGRFNSLLECFNLKNNLCTNLEDIIKNNMLGISIDYTIVQECLNNKKTLSINWLKSALKEPITNNITEYDIFNIINKKQQRVSKHKQYYKAKYLLYRLLFNFTWGKSRNKMKLEKEKYKNILSSIKIYN